LWDWFHTLWPSYLASNPASFDKVISKIWFGSNMGLCLAPIGEKQQMPICPVFKQILIMAFASFN